MAKMMSKQVLQKSLRVTGVRRCRHISHVTPDLVWVSDVDNNLVLTNKVGDDLHHLTDIASAQYGIHTVNSDKCLIYIDSAGNVLKLSTDNKTKSTLIKYAAPWRPRCIYSSRYTGDLLVGMVNTDNLGEGKVALYNSNGEQLHTIQHDNAGQQIFSEPKYITENHNGDIIVSDWFLNAVVVTEHGGRHRFSYKGPPGERPDFNKEGSPSESKLWPLAICTDDQSNILICDPHNTRIHMIDKNGDFLSFILTKTRTNLGELFLKGTLKEDDVYMPQSLSYDEKTNLLWVGLANNNMVEIYKCRYLQDIKCKKHPRFPLDQFCTPCGVPLCVDCTRTEDHSEHDLRNIESLFEEINRIEDGDTLLMCLLLFNSYKINMKEENWMNRYNAVANSFHSREITEPFALTELERYKPILKYNESEISFSLDLFKDISFLKFSKNSKFLDIFLTWAEKENVAEYCRSWNYRREEDEVCCRLMPENSEEFLNRLGEDIFTHPTMEDHSFHETVFRKFGIPIQVIMRGDKSVKNFIENLKKGKTMMFQASGMIVGCAGSGKTTLLQRLKGIDLAEITRNVTSTRGVDIHTDVFDVTESIQVNSSSQQQRFKLRLETKDLKQSVSEHSENAANDGEMQEEIKQVDDMDTYEASNIGQILHGETNIETLSSYDPQGKTSPENVEEILYERQGVPNSSGFSGNLQIEAKNILDPERRITISDFAGQCSYYASHQIFLSSRAFFILVLNMEKKFDDKVGEEVCCQEGSVYGGWTNRDYLEFWMTSIHEYSSDKAPVILVGTHSENKTEEEKELFFREVWKTLDMKKKSLQKHIDVKRRFAVGFHDNESIEKIKLSIADVVCRLDHWGEELPQSWAMFETFFREKRVHKILSRDEFESFNETLPEGIKLRSTDYMTPMLQFFHDIRDIIHFNQQFLNQSIILDVQWFADAFKNVITDKNHAKEDLFEFASEWDKFNETGELDETLLSAIWRMNNNGYIEHKENILLYMEKLGLLAKMSDKKWYVPCMNKMQFPVDCFSSYPASSILCYTFDVLPAGIFHRLVATCMQIPWEIFNDGERGCIYQTAAVFVFHDLCHNILIGMTQTEIQLQVFVTDGEGEVDVLTCHQIREIIESKLSGLANTFQNNSGFHVAFKCKPAGFCDSKESAVINESQFTRPTFQCPPCPARKKHAINTKDITKYWKQEPQTEDVDNEGKLPSPVESLERTPTDTELLMVSRHIGGIFRLIGIGLGLDSATIEQINIDYMSQGVRTQIFQILVTWKNREGRQATVRKLLDVINEFRGEVDFEMIERVFNQ